MSSARILLISRGWSEKEIWRSSLAEFQDVLLGIDDVDLVTPTAMVRGNGRLSRAVQGRLHRATGVKLAFDIRLNPVHIERDYDLCCFYAQNIDELAILDALPNWRSRCRRAVCWIEELWLTEVARDSHVTALRQFDRLVVPFCNTVETLRKVAEVPCDWRPHGVDALRFHPGAFPPSRRIDIFSMGRRSDLTHEAIRKYASEQKWFYHFDTTQSAKVANLLEHRQQLAELIKRSRYFLVNKAKAGETAQPAGQEELGSRYFEGAAAGAVLVGDVPRSTSFGQCFDWPDAVFRIPYASTEVGRVFDQLEAEPDRVSAVRRQNIVQSLLRFDWAYRWQDVLRSVGLPPSKALRTRLAKLADIAATYGTNPVAPAGRAEEPEVVAASAVHPRL